jgi:S-adenosylmethionine synthetase
MKTRINLTIEENLVQQIKSYAAKRQTSVSDLVEEYFTRIVKPTKKKNFVEMVKSLPKHDIDKDLDLKKAFYEEQASKYGF